MSAQEENFGTLLAFFKVLSNESRLRIVGLLARGPMTVGDLAGQLSIKEPTVSHHLTRLREIGLVTLETRSNLHIYRLNHGMLRQMSLDLLSREQVASLVENAEPLSWQDKVLATFVEEGRIRQFPVKQKKQLVLLGWLVEHFEQGRDYSEKEVNAIIKPIFADTAYLRRRLISFGFMQREKGVYRRSADFRESDLPTSAPALPVVD
jgi:predicted transcriptional regulator